MRIGLSAVCVKLMECLYIFPDVSLGVAMNPPCQNPCDEESGTDDTKGDQCLGPFWRIHFTASIAAADGGVAHSAEAVRDRIRQLIDEEEPADVLSDDAIVDVLREGGIDIARRTVAKYREAMNIASSVQRRREKRALANAGR